MPSKDKTRIRFRASVRKTTLTDCQSTRIYGDYCIKN